MHVNVPAATLDAAQPGLEDCASVDSTGNQVPYLIERLLPDPESTIRPTEFRSTIENGATHLILKTGTRAVKGYGKGCFVLGIRLDDFPRQKSRDSVIFHPIGLAVPLVFAVDELSGDREQNGNSSRECSPADSGRCPDPEYKVSIPCKRQLLRFLLVPDKG